MVLICGVDEAGRGPVIGPLVICGVTIQEENLPLLEKLGVKDSKLLTPKQRDFLFEKIIKTVKDYKLIIIPPREIDEALASNEINLNWLEAIKTAEIINHLKPQKVIVDCPSNNIKAYSSYLKDRLNNNDVEVICAHKADVKFIIVSAASVIAKVVRDREIEEIKKELGKDIGSGYPSDPTTKKFLQENWDKHPEIFRKSWQTYKNVSNKKGQKRLDKF
ncbi:ribonuclease HII [Candidatus Woesearchaeota archaeon]|nr:ribonuclease HII [Candidatus Woesearchaeota archaeon]